MTFTDAIEYKIQNYIPETPMLVFAPPAIGVMSAIGLDLTEAGYQQYLIDCQRTGAFDIHPTILDICEQNPNNKYIFMFDEIDRITKDAFNAACNAIFTRKCNGRQIPDNVTICARIAYKGAFESTHFKSDDEANEFYHKFMTLQSNVETKLGQTSTTRRIGFRLWR